MKRQLCFFDLMINAALRETRGPKTESGTISPYYRPCTGKMDVDIPDRCRIMGQDEVQDHQERQVDRQIDPMSTG